MVGPHAWHIPLHLAARETAVKQGSDRAGRIAFDRFAAGAHPHRVFAGPDADVVLESLVHLAGCRGRNERLEISLGPTGWEFGLGLSGWFGVLWFGRRETGDSNRQ